MNSHQTNFQAKTTTIKTKPCGAGPVVRV